MKQNINQLTSFNHVNMRKWNVFNSIYMMCNSLAQCNLALCHALALVFITTHI